MKKTTFKIRRGLKTFLLSFAVMGGAYWLAQAPKTATYAFAPIGLVAGLKKKGVKLEESEEAFVTSLETELNETLKDAHKGLLTEEQFAEKLEAAKTKFLEGITIDGKTVKIGEKTIETILREQGEQITALKASAPGKRKSLKDMLGEKMGEVEKIFGKQDKEIVLSLKVADIMTTTTAVDDSDMPEDLIESFSVDAFVPKRQPRQYVFDIASRTTVQSVEKYKTWLEEGDKDGAMAIVSEGAVKPLVDLALVRNKSEVQKAAGKYVVTEEFTKFRREAYNIIKNLINDRMLRDYNAITTTNLLNDAASYVGSALDDQYENPTDYHAIAAVAAQIEALDFMPDVLIMNPQDKWRIGMSQDTMGQFYLTIPVTDPSGQTRMMGFMLRTSTLVPTGTFILGESGLWKIEEEALTIRMGYGISSDGAGGYTSDFDNNRFRVIVETFFHNYIATNNTGSFVKAQFATVKEAVAKPEV